jgi:hypothetical protein
MVTVIAVVVALAVGFGIGRIKNTGKLAKIKDGLDMAEEKLRQVGLHYEANVVAVARKLL